MDLILETERLIHRPLLLSDLDEFFIMNYNPNVNLYMRNPIKSKNDVYLYIQKIINEYESNKIGRFAVILKETNEFIGFSGLKFRDKLENGHINFYDIGYRFSEKYWHKGFATESSLAWLDYGFNTMKLPTIYACAFSDNVGSNKVLNKIGFEFINQYLDGNLFLNWYEIKQK